MAILARWLLCRSRRCRYYSYLDYYREHPEYGSVQLTHGKYHAAEDMRWKRLQGRWHLLPADLRDLSKEARLP